MKRLLIASSFVLSLGLFALPANASDGCYTCGSGSSEACKHYCRYGSSDTSAARKACEAKGCKISGTGSCPTAVNYKVCSAPVSSNVIPASWLR